jgi:excisionase family DNA binding protein
MRVIELSVACLYDLAAAAQLLGVSEGTLRGWVERGAIPYWQPGGEGGSIFFSGEALLRCAAEESARRNATPTRKTRPAPHPDKAAVAPVVLFGEGKGRKRTP